MFFVFSSSGASRAWLQRAGSEKLGQAGAGHYSRRDRLAGGYTGQSVSAAVCAPAPRRGLQHPASAAPPGHPLPGLHWHRAGRGQQRESQRVWLSDKMDVVILYFLFIYLGVELRIELLCDISAVPNKLISWHITSVFSVTGLGMTGPSRAQGLGKHLFL